MMRLRSARDDTGAAAVEFALILPVLMILILGLVEFSLVFNAQISMTNAAREGARYMAIHNNATDATQEAIDAAPSMNPGLSADEVAVSPSACARGVTVTVTIEHDQGLVTGFFGDVIPLTGKGVMLCGG